MTEEKESSIGKSLKESVKSLFNVGGDLIRKLPMLVVIFFGLVVAAIYSVSHEEDTSKIIISILIGLFSIGIYLKNDSFSETILTLFLGLLTVFSIQWTHTNTVIFSSILCSFMIIYFLISSIKVSSEIEAILTDASIFLSVKDHSYYLKKLRVIATTQTKYGQMNIKDRAKAARFLVFAKVPLEQMPYLISLIEMIKVIYQVSFEDAWGYFYTLNRIQNKIENRNVSLYDIEYIHEKFCKLPIMPAEFIDITNETKSVLISQKYNFESYLNKLSDMLDEGYSKNNIIQKLNDE